MHFIFLPDFQKFTLEDDLDKLSIQNNLNHEATFPLCKTVLLQSLLHNIQFSLLLCYRIIKS